MALADELFISVTKVFPVVAYLERNGIAKENFLSELGLGADILDFPENKLSLAQLDDIFLLAERLLNDEFIGLHVGETITKGFSSILGHILLNCATLSQALEKYCVYERLVDDTTRTSVYREGNNTIIESTIKESSIRGSRQLLEYKMSGIRAYAVLLAKKQFPIVMVEFVHAAPVGRGEYERVFRSPVLFNRRRNGLVVDSKHLRLRIPEPNRELLSVFEGHAAATLKSLSLGDSFRKKASDIIIHTMNGRIPTVEEVAQHLAVSVRTLQMRLSKEGTSYRQLLDEIRKEVAFRYLRDKTVTIAEVAYLLGFSETSAFHRAFKGWTKLTPTEYRVSEASVLA